MFYLEKFMFFLGTGINALSEKHFQKNTKVAGDALVLNVNSRYLYYFRQLHQKRAFLLRFYQRKFSSKNLGTDTTSCLGPYQISMIDIAFSKYLATKDL